MSWTLNFGWLRSAAVALSLVVAAGQALAAPCGLCATKVTINGALAACYLELYPELATRAGEAIAVDLTSCPEDRGVVAELSSPAAGSIEPDRRFILSRSQLSCLHDRLDNPAAVLDPSAMIRLDDCE